MSSFAVNDCLDATQRFAVLLGDFSDPNIFSCCLKFSVLDGCLYATLFLLIVHKFSMGLRSGLFPGHFSRDSLFFFRNSMATVEWTCMCSFSFSFCLSNSTYLGPFKVVLGGMTYRPPAPRHDMTPQIILLGWCFNVATTYFLSRRLPNGEVQTAAWCICQKTTFLFHSTSPMAIMSGKVQSLFLVHWCQVWLSCRPVRLQSTFFAEILENVLELIAVPFKGKIAQISL